MTTKFFTDDGTEVFADMHQLVASISVSANSKKSANWNSDGPLFGFKLNLPGRIESKEALEALANEAYATAKALVDMNIDVPPQNYETYDSFVGSGNKASTTVYSPPPAPAPKPAAPVQAQPKPASAATGLINGQSFNFLPSRPSQESMQVNDCWASKISAFAPMKDKNGKSYIDITAIKPPYSDVTKTEKIHVFQRDNDGGLYTHVEQLMQAWVAGNLGDQYVVAYHPGGSFTTAKGEFKNVSPLMIVSSPDEFAAQLRESTPF